MKKEKPILGLRENLRTFGVEHYVVLILVVISSIWGYTTVADQCAKDHAKQEAQLNPSASF